MNSTTSNNNRNTPKYLYWSQVDNPLISCFFVCLAFTLDQYASNIHEIFFGFFQVCCFIPINGANKNTWPIRYLASADDTPIQFFGTFLSEFFFNIRIWTWIFSHQFFHLWIAQSFNIETTIAMIFYWKFVYVCVSVCLLSNDWWYLISFYSFCQLKHCQERIFWACQSTFFSQHLLSSFLNTEEIFQFPLFLRFYSVWIFNLLLYGIISPFI